MTKLILLPSLLQEAEATLPRLVLQIEIAGTTAVKTAKCAAGGVETKEQEQAPRRRGADPVSVNRPSKGVAEAITSVVRHSDSSERDGGSNTSGGRSSDKAIFRS